ncbi:dihydroorotate dehydrogenase [Annulohypoxylon truncatum]|uniref:dihydroorotate dehydrogenase n=1 Tax=Annulohypoxylon truncatum TaxID=327061 RepID=UPI002007566C|nr:dihydroorotate dehydrogenase [Annulohypoxylon truncatum]KAI1207145.1 dihydroorotate dehydrogenase [Annulohypoxylon truncatum]
MIPAIVKTTMSLPPALSINPPLLNSANPWATTLEDLTALFECPSTGAVTTRTALLNGFPHDPDTHQYSFFDPGSNTPTGRISTPGGDETAGASASASLNNMGYSPIPLDAYLGFVETIAREKGPRGKGFVVSVTGPPDHVAECYARVAEAQKRIGEGVPLALEVNLSCPNIPGAPPPAYDAVALGTYLEGLAGVAGARAKGDGDGDGEGVRIPWGVKTPPYTHAGQFAMLVSALRGAAARAGSVCPVSFVTATNTLGSCLVLEATGTGSSEKGEGEGKGKGGPRLAGTGIGGMAGPPLHPLALGNVKTLRETLDEAPETRHVQIIGVGGVGDADGYRRMRGVGAAAVGVGTALGRRGVGVFEEIERGLGGRW